MRKLHEAACTITALTDLTAIGMEDRWTGEGHLEASRFHQQQLVKANTKVPVSQ